MRLSRSITLPGLLSVAALVACGDAIGVSDPGTVAVNFQVTIPTAPAAVGPVGAGPAMVAPAQVAGPPLTIAGTNGTLTIDEIRLIVAEVELDGDDDACQDDAPAASDCADFEAPPRFLDLPLDGQPVEAFVGLIPAGTYAELEFSIQDLEDDESDTDFAAEIAALRDDILAEFADWPQKATALVVGTFEPSSGDPVDFRVYLEAEIEIERELVPPIVIADDGSGATDLTVDIRPDLWFTRSDGTVIDLTGYDYDETGSLFDFELEMEHGFTEIETEHENESETEGG